MKKLEEGLWMYKGVKVTRDLNGNYVSDKMYLNDLTLPMFVTGATQKSFKSMFDMVVKNNGGLKDVR